MRYLLIIVCMLTMQNCMAQTDSTKQQDVRVKLAVFHNNHLNYYGRTDSLKSAGLFPVAEIWFGKKIYLSATPVFVSNAQTSLDYAGTVLMAGYRVEKPGKSVLGLYVMKPVYERGAALVQSSLKGQASGTFSLLNKWINVNAGADLKLSDATDVSFSAGLDHLFRWQLGERSVLVVDPSCYAYFGTQRYSKTYTKQSSFLFFPGIQQQVTERATAFNLLSMELSSPVVLAWSKTQFIFNPAYVMPHNLLRVENRPDISERGESMFYFTLGLKQSF